MDESLFETASRARSARRGVDAAGHGNCWPGPRTVGTSITWQCWFHRALWHGHAGDGCRATVDSEFAVGVLKMLGNGPRADLQRMGDGGVGAAVSDESQDLDLALGQSGEPAVGHRGERLPGLLTSAGPAQGGVQRGPEHTEQSAILVGEVAEIGRA